MDEFYNERAARWARDVVMKLDDDEVQPFVTQVVHGVLHEHIAKNRRTVDRRIATVQKNLLGAAERSTAKGTLIPVIAEVSKAQWDENRVKRDQGGKFARVESRIRTNKTQPAMRKRTERNSGIPSARGLATATGTSKQSGKLTREQRSAYQQQYLAIADALDVATERGAKGIDVVLQDKRTGRRHTAKDVSNLNNVNWWNPGTHDAISVRYDAPGGGAGAASFDLVSALGGSRSAAGNTERAVNAVDRGGAAFASQWTDASGDTLGTNDRTYRRIEAGSKLLGQMPNDKAKVAGALGEFVGSFGPEAEKVVGPHMRKTAYRYRGTEKTPDKELREAFRQATGGQPPADAEGRITAAEQAATYYLMTRLPNDSLLELHRKSGKIPPSEGVIIDRNGNIVTQAVGFAEDHYLPFNLKNLKGLDGGAYVRTRSRGGLTTEDIYTGLVSGAREVTVVSNSGTFTIEFAPDFRGIRRYNDKAAGMVERYAKTLDAIRSESVEREKLDPRVRAELREEVEREMPRALGFTEAQISNAIKERERDFKANPQLTTSELDKIRERAKKDSEGDERLERRMVAEYTDAALETRRNRFYRLDGEGYAAALQALKEQYPYYINDISYMNRRNMKKFRDQPTNPNDPQPQVLQRFGTGSDEGYVAPRYNRPQRVEEGYHDPNIAGEGYNKGTGKTPAAFTNYQNWEHNPARGASRAHQGDVEAQTQDKPQEATPERLSGRQRAMRGQQAAAQSQRYTTSLKDALSVYAPVTGDMVAQSMGESDAQLLAEARENWDSVANDPTKAEALEGVLTRLQANLAAQPKDTPGGAASVRIAEQAQQKLTVVQATKQSNARTNQYSNEPAYMRGAPPDTINQEAKKLNAAASSLGINASLSTEDQQLTRMSQAAQRITRALDSDLQQPSAYGAVVAAGTDLGLAPDAIGALLDQAEQPGGAEQLKQRMEQIADTTSRMQALRANMQGNLPEGATGNAGQPAAQITNSRNEADLGNVATNGFSQRPKVSEQQALSVAGNLAQSDSPDRAVWNNIRYALEQGNKELAREQSWSLSPEDSLQQTIIDWLNDPEND